MEVVSDLITKAIPLYQASSIYLDLYVPETAGYALLFLFGYYNFNTPRYPLAYREGTTESDAGQLATAEAVALEQTKALAPPLYTTRRKKYRRYRRLYIFGLSVIYVVVVFFPAQSGQAGAAAGFLWDLPESLDERAMLCLLVLMAEATSVPGLRDLHQALLRKLHGMAIIPADARMTARHLYSDGQYDPPREIKRRAISEVERMLPSGINPESKLPALRSKVSGLEFNWLKLNCLYFSLTNLLQESSLPKRFSQIFEHEIEAVKTEYTKRKNRMEEYSQIEKAKVNEYRKEKNTENPNDRIEENTRNEFILSKMGESAKSLLEWRDKLNFKNEVMYFRICLLVCLLVFSSKSGDKNILNKFRELGFTTNKHTPPPLSSLVMAQAFFIILGICLLSALVYEIVRVNTNLTIDGSFVKYVSQGAFRSFLTSFIVVALHMMCLYGGVNIKREFIRRRKKRIATVDIQTKENASIFIVLYAATLSVGVGAFSALLGEITFLPGLAWAIVPATTGVFAGHYIDRVETLRMNVFWPITLHTFIAMASALFAIIVLTLGNYEYQILKDAGSLFWLHAAKGTLLSGLIAVAIGVYYPKAHLARICERGASEVDIRKAIMDDLDVVMACVLAANRDFAPRALREFKLVADTYGDAIQANQCWIAETSGVCVGSVALFPDEEGSMMLQVAVLPAFQGRRLGRRLLDFAEKQAFKSGVLETRILANQRFPENISYYRRLGYEEVGPQERHGAQLLCMNKRYDPVAMAA